MLQGGLGRRGLNATKPGQSPLPFPQLCSLRRAPSRPPSYQHEVLVSLQLLQALGQPLSLLLSGLILQAPQLLVPLLFPGGFALDLAHGDHYGKARPQRGRVLGSLEAMRHRENKTGRMGRNTGSQLCDSGEPLTLYGFQSSVQRGV